VKTQGGAKGLFKRLTSTLAGRDEDQREGEVRDKNHSNRRRRRSLLWQSRAGTRPGRSFRRKMTCMNFYPRSATVVAESDVVAYEMLRNVLDIMMKNKTFKAQIDETYRRRALENHLRGVPMFADLAPDFIEHLKETVELQRFAPGQVIARQGDTADSFYLVRIGLRENFGKNYPGGRTRPCVPFARRLFR